MPNKNLLGTQFKHLFVNLDAIRSSVVQLPQEQSPKPSVKDEKESPSISRKDSVSVAGSYRSNKTSLSLKETSNIGESPVLPENIL